MKIEKLEDLLEIDTDSMKAPENKRLLTKLKQLLKGGIKQVVKADEIAEDFPYTAVSVVGGKYVKLKFDLESKRARVVETVVDVHGRDFITAAKAIKELTLIAKKQKEIK